MAIASGLMFQILMIPSGIIFGLAISGVVTVELPELVIPEDWRSQKLALRLLIGPRDGYGSTAEAQLYVNGVPLQALDAWHPDVWLPAKYAGQDEISLAIWGWSGMFKTLSTYPVDIHFSNQAGILLRYLHGTEVHHTPGQPPKHSQWPR